MNHCNLLTLRLFVFLSIVLLLAGCAGKGDYRPINEDFGSLLEEGNKLDSTFVEALTAPDVVSFNRHAKRFMELYYAQTEEETDFKGFNSETSSLARQDTLLFFMQDYLLNDNRFDESIFIGKVLSHRAIEKGQQTVLNSESLNDMAVASFYLGNLDEAIGYQKASYEIDRRLDDPKLISSDLNQLAAMCLRSKKYDLARDYISEAIRIEEMLNRRDVLAIRYGLASEIYLKLNDLSTAKDYILRALALERELGRREKEGVRLSQLAAIQIADSDFIEATQSLAKALPLLKDANNHNSLAITNCQLGELALHYGNSSQAQQYFYEALLLCRTSGLKPIETRALHGLWLAMKGSNPSLGAEYLERYTALSDSLRREDSDSQLATLKAEYATRELQLENERLSEHNRVHEIILYCTILTLTLLLLIGWLIYRNRMSRQRLMQQMEKVRLNFFTNITHEFRTPLTVILGLSSDLEKANASTRQQAEMISQEGKRLLNLVNQLLDIGKVSSSIGEAQWRHGNIIGYLNMLVESVRPWAVSKNVDLVFAPASNDVEMDFVPDYISKIVRNILSNALKYTNPEGQVLISARVEGSKLLLRFADNGNGIEREDIEHIFELFYQGVNSKTNVGTGIGLSLVKLLVDALNGEISVKSRPGIGTVFILTLPLKQSDRKVTETLADEDYTESPMPQIVTPAPAPSLEAEMPRTLPVVLIVEDNVNVANYISSQLSDRYHVYTAHNGEEGLARALNLVPDLIITDVMMPVMDGYEFVKNLRESDILSHLPVIMVTARTSDKDRIEGINSGADAYISKPFNSDELRAVAAHLIEQRLMLCEKYKAMTQPQPELVEDTDAQDRSFIRQLIQVIYTLISEHHKIDISIIAARMNLSERSLTRKVQSLTGETTVAFVNRVKIDKAKRQLETDDTSSLSDIALQCGFDDPAYFSRIFKQVTGLTPTSYRKQSKCNIINV